MISFASPSITHASFLAVKSRPSISTAGSSRRVSASYASSTVERPRAGSDSLYEVLGIRMEATCQEIKSAYRKLARVVHPDVASPANGSAVEEFIKVHEAYSTLSDPGKRANYDRALYGRQWSANTTLRSSSGFYGASSSSRPRTWETDQCW